MYTLLSHISDLFEDIVFVLSQSYKTPNRGRLLLDTIRLHAKAPLNKYIKYENEKFLGYVIKTPDWYDFFMIFREIFVKRVYYFETEKESPNIVDCGGNIGMSVLFFKYVYPKSVIKVFEPNPYIFEVLNENLLNNNIKDVELYKLALSDTKGSVKLHMPDDRQNAGGGTISTNVVDSKQKGGYVKSFKQVDVEMDLLSSYLASKVDLLKMDVEGVELRILKDLKSHGKLELVNGIVLEYHHDRFNSDNSLIEFLNILEDNRYRYIIHQPDIYPGFTSKVKDIYHFAIKAEQIKNI